MLIVGKEASEAYFTRMRSNVLFIGESKAWAKSVLRNVLKTGLALSNTHPSKGQIVKDRTWREMTGVRSQASPWQAIEHTVVLLTQRAAIHTIRQRAEGSLQMIITMDDDAAAYAWTSKP
jgi:hypothetical protein